MTVAWWVPTWFLQAGATRAAGATPRPEPSSKHLYADQGV